VAETNSEESRVGRGSDEGITLASSLGHGSEEKGRPHVEVLIAWAARGADVAGGRPTVPT
jgi:hypothetical protein